MEGKKPFLWTNKRMWEVARKKKNNSMFTGNLLSCMLPDNILLSDSMLSDNRLSGKTILSNEADYT
jgi:hypothetical protein